MIIQKKVLSRRLVYGCFLVLLISGVMGAVVASSGGRPGRSGNPHIEGGLTCAQCHGGGEIPNVLMHGPAVVAPGTTVTYTLRISGGQEVAGGFNVSASGGEVAAPPGAADVQVIPWAWDDGITIRDEVTHTEPKAADGDGVVSFAFSWTAPDEPSLAILYGAGNSVNGNGNPTGDGVAAVQKVINAVSTVYLPVGLNN